ncbi:MAG: AMP-binding protein [Candidatus Eisenbacteria bacterium]
MLRKLREVAGGRLRGTISGGGALPLHIDEFLNYAGIPLLEGYGLTETSPVVAFRTWRKRVIGTVGPLYPGTEVRIVDLSDRRVLYPDPAARGGGRGRSGEVEVRGPQVMRGYYKDVEGTARVLVDGWFRTGDIGVMTWNDCLKIVGRSKDTIVLRSGENVEPGPIEAALLGSPLIAHCMLVGQDEKHLGLLLVPSDTALELGDGAQRAVESEVARLISPATGWKSFERIAQVALVPKPFEVGDELTATYKLRRHHITAKYRAEIARLFAAGDR